MNEERKLLNVYKGILDIFQALEKAKSEEEVMKLYVEYLKLQVQLTTNKPIFQSNPNGFKYGNCYTYALDLKCPEIFWNRCKTISIQNRMGFDVGLITAKRKVCVENSSEVMLVDNFYRDCEALRIKVYENGWLNFIPEHNGYIILMYKNVGIARNYDYHFVRVNADGVFSHRMGFNDLIVSMKSLDVVSDRYEFVNTYEIVKPVIRERGL